MFFFVLVPLIYLTYCWVTGNAFFSGGSIEKHSAAVNSEVLEFLRTTRRGHTLLPSALHGRPVFFCTIAHYYNIFTRRWSCLCPARTRDNLERRKDSHGPRRGAARARARSRSGSSGAQVCMRATLPTMTGVWTGDGCGWVDGWMDGWLAVW